MLMPLLLRPTAGAWLERSTPPAAVDVKGNIARWPAAGACRSSLPFALSSIVAAVVAVWLARSTPISAAEVVELPPLPPLPVAAVTNGFLRYAAAFRNKTRTGSGS